MGNKTYKKLRRTIKDMGFSDEKDIKKHYKRMKKIYLRLPVEAREDFLILIKNKSNNE